MMGHIAQGSMMFIIDIDTENGGMQMNNDFCVDFGDEPDGPALAHEVRLKLKYQMQNKQFPREKTISKGRSALLQIHYSKNPQNISILKNPTNCLYRC